MIWHYGAFPFASQVPQNRKTLPSLANNPKQETEPTDAVPISCRLLVLELRRIAGGAFGVVRFTEPLADETNTLAHELGHNWGLDHCDDVGNGTRCLNHTMNPQNNGANNFHNSITVPRLIAFRDTLNCVDEITMAKSIFESKIDDERRVDHPNGSFTIDASTAPLAQVGLVAVAP